MSNPNKRAWTEEALREIVADKKFTSWLNNRDYYNPKGIKATVGLFLDYLSSLPEPEVDVYFCDSCKHWASRGHKDKCQSGEELTAIVTEDHMMSSVTPEPTKEDKGDILSAKKKAWDELMHKSSPTEVPEPIPVVFPNLCSDCHKVIPSQPLPEIATLGSVHVRTFRQREQEEDLVTYKGGAMMTAKINELIVAVNKLTQREQEGR